MSLSSPTTVAVASSCTLSQFLDDVCWDVLYHNNDFPYFLIILIEFLVLAYSFAGLSLAADHMCNSMETLCDHWSVPEDVGGASFMAFGSSVPEITVNAISTLQGIGQNRGVLKSGVKNLSFFFIAATNLRARSSLPQDAEESSEADLGVGGILGSGMIAFLLIPSICVAFAPTEEGLVLKKGPLRRDIGFYTAALLLLICALHLGGSSLALGVAMLAVYAAYLVVLLGERRKAVLII